MEWFETSVRSLGGPMIVSNDELFDLRLHKARIAWRGATRAGLSVYRRLDPQVLEVLALKAAVPGQGVGSALLKDLVLIARVFDMVATHFGDHQPKFTKDLVPDAESQSLYVTRFTIEGINRHLSPTPDWGGGNLDIAYLPALVLSASGLRQDDVFSARLDLMQRCKGLYASCGDPLKRQIHRTLVDRGLVDVDAVLEQQPAKLAGNQY